MIIQCEQCRTRFRLDDSRITASGVRVRCSKCSHTFVVRKEEPATENDFDTILKGFDRQEEQATETEAPVKDGNGSPDLGVSWSVGPGVSGGAQEPPPSEASSQVVPESPQEQPPVSEKSFSLGDDFGDKAFSWDAGSFTVDVARETPQAEEDRPPTVLEPPREEEKPAMPEGSFSLGDDFGDKAFSWDSDSFTAEGARETPQAEEDRSPTVSEPPPEEEKPAMPEGSSGLGTDFGVKAFSWESGSFTAEGTRETPQAEEDRSPTVSEPPPEEEEPAMPKGSFSLGDDLGGKGFSWDDKPAAPEGHKEETTIGEGIATDQERDQAEQPRETPGDMFSPFFTKGVGLPQFQMGTGHYAQGGGIDTGSKTPAAAEPTSPDVCPEREPAAEKDSGTDLQMEPGTGGFPHEELKTGGGSEPSIAEGMEKSQTGQSAGDIWAFGTGSGPKESAVSDEELSPLPIASRRKGISLRPVILGSLLVLVAAGAGFYLVKTDTLNRILPDEIAQKLGMGKKAAPLASVRSMEGRFIVNKDAGELLVMQGEAINTSGKTLSSLKVQGVIYGAGGAVLAQRTVFCGNVLTPDALANLPYSSLEKAMNKQFGDNLANFQVAPGKVIPFMLVFKDVPKGARDFGVEIVDREGGNLK